MTAHVFCFVVLPFFLLLFGCVAFLYRRRARLRLDEFHERHRAAKARYPFPFKDDDRALEHKLTEAEGEWDMWLLIAVASAIVYVCAVILYAVIA